MISPSSILHESLANSYIVQKSSWERPRRKVSLRKEIWVPFRALLFLGKWYGATTYFSLYQKKKKNTNYKILDCIVPLID